MQETISSARELMLALAVGFVVKTHTSRNHPDRGDLVQLGLGF